MAWANRKVDAQCIVEILPSLSEDIVQQVLEKLEECGVSTCDDLRHVRECDISSVLRPIHVRRLLAEWTSSGDGSSKYGESPSIQTPPTTAATTPVQCASSASSPPVTPRSSHDWAKFQFPLEKMPESLRNAIASKLRPTHADRREMIRILGDSVYMMSKRPGRAALRAIAKCIISQYPDSFQDKVNDCVIGDGSSTLLSQMEYRLDNLNRDASALKRDAVSPATSTDESSTPKSKRVRSSDSYGCVDFQPDIPKGKGLDELKQSQADLISKSALLSIDWVDVEISMRATFCLQRADINSGKTTADMLINWPFLFWSQGIDLHFTLLIGQPLLETTKTAYTSKVPSLLKYFEEHGTKKMKSAVCDLNNAEDMVKSTFPEVIGVVHLLAIQFGESLEDLISVIDESSSVDEASVNLPATPTLIAFGTSALTAKSFMLGIDGVVVLHAIQDPLTAIGLLFGAFFVFNLHYPASASITLEFIQRMFMQINPTRGTKAKTKGKKQHHIHPKVLQLANALRDAESLWTVS